MLSLGSFGLASFAAVAVLTDHSHGATLMKPGRRLYAVEARQDLPAWQQIQCTDDGANNADRPEDERWELLGTNGAWDDSVNGWKQSRIDRPDSDFPFPRSMSNFFNGPEFMDCHKLIENNGCHGGNALQCHDTNHPAGYFILNSFRKLDGVLWNMIDTLGQAHDSVGGDIGIFSSVFAPIKVENMNIDVILDIVSLGYSGMAAPIWNKVLKKWKFAENRPNDYDTLSDFTTDMTQGGITLAKDLTSSEAPTLETQNEVSEKLKIIINIWKDSIVQYAGKIFGGDDENIGKLGKIIANGKMIATNTDIPSVTELRETLERSIYAILIPMAWRLSDRGISPFVLDSGLSCGDADGGWGSQKDDKFLAGNVKGSVKVCFEDRAYYLVGASGDCHGGTPFDDPDTKNCEPFAGLPGADTLGGDKWGKLNRDDFVIGSLNTFRSNGNKNHENAVKWSDGISNDHVGAMGEDIRAANTFLLPICSLATAWNNFHSESADKSKFNFPCDVDHSPDFNKPPPAPIPPPFDCSGSGMCGGAVNFVRDCDRAVNNELMRNDDVNYGSADSDKDIDGARRGNCKIFIAGPSACTRTGNEMWYDYQDLRKEGSCGKCGSKHWGNNNECRTTVNYVA
ncbi:hypothetical protein ACHAQA_004856 [Verticillium albo-atrum]